MTGTAHARAGFLGNPSDGYHGKAIALPVFDFTARAYVEPSDRFVLHPGPSDLLEFATLADAARTFRDGGCDDGLRLVRAAVKRFWEHHAELGSLPADDARLRVALRYETDIPRQVGLAGSSAIVIATLRALSAWFGTSTHPADLAEVALAAEVEDLGIAAGPMDRVVQAYEAALVMDLRPPRTRASYQTLDPSALPPLFIAWDPRGAESSGRPHGELRARWEQRDPEVLGVIDELREVVDLGMAALERGDVAALRELMKRNFALRSRVFRISEQDRRMVALAAAHGAAAKLCGSGGAVIGIPGADGVTPELEGAFIDAGFRLIRPRVAASAPA